MSNKYTPGSAGPDQDNNRDDYFNRYDERMTSPVHSGAAGRGTPGAHRPIQLEDRGYYGGNQSPLEIPMGPAPMQGGLGRVGTPSDRLQGQPTVRTYIWDGGSIQLIICDSTR